MKATRPDVIVPSIRVPTLLKVRWRKSFTLTLDGMLTPGRERLVIGFGCCAQSFCLWVSSEPTNVHSFFEMARAWRSSPRDDACRVLPQRRVSVRLPLLRCRHSRAARLALNSFLFNRWRTNRERIPGTVRVDVRYVFAPFIRDL